MRKKLAGIHLLAPLSETDIVDYSRNLDRELIVNSTIVTDAIVDTVEKTNYIVTFEYDTTLDGGTHQIRRSIPTLELLSYTGENMSGAHWVNVEDMDYHYITPGTTSQQAFEELDEQISKLSGLKYIIDGTGTGTLVSSLDGKTSSVTVDAGEYIIVLGESHTASNTEHSVILGGVGSDISASFGSMSRYNLIAASVNGRIQGNNSSMSVYGGIDNYIIGDSAVGNTIVNGRGNLIYGAIRESTIINGSDNIISISSKYGYADSVIESNKGYILDSEYSSVNNSSRVTIMNSRYSTSDHSAYIEINNSNHCSVNSSEYTSILDSAESNIINSINSSDGLSIYGSYLSSIQNSNNSYIWGGDYSSILGSSSSSIGKEYMPASISSTGKTHTSLIFDSVSEFTLGQSVMLIGAEYTSTTSKYQIAEIDENTKSIRFVNESYTYITFDTANSNNISMYALNVDAITPEYNVTILSNTSDTIVLSHFVFTDSYPYTTIDGYTQKYKVVDALGLNSLSATIKLKLFESNAPVTNLVPNSLTGKHIRQYNITNAHYTMLLGGTYNHVHSGAFVSVISSNGIEIKRGNGASVIASDGNTIVDYSNVIIMGSDGNYISGYNHAIITSNGNYITNGYRSIIIGSAGNYITECYNTSIINGSGNYIENDLANVSMIACNNVHATRSNVLMTPSLTLVDKTLELNGKTPSIGDTLVVESINGNVATLKWGKPATSNSLFQSLTYTMWGERVISHAYITVGPDETVYDNNMAVDLTTSGVINTKYTSTWDSSYIANSNDGITIEDGYRHVISIDSFDAKWVNASANAPIVTMSAPKITITESNNIVTYTTSAGGSGTLLANNETAGAKLISGFTASGSNTAILNLYIHRPTVNDPAIVTFSTVNIKQSSEYAEGVETPIYIDANGMPDVYWPVDYILPTAGEYAWFKSPDAQLGLNSYWWRAIVSVNPNTRLVRIEGNSTLRVSSQFNCYLWYMKETPRFKVTANISVMKISTAILI